MSDADLLGVPALERNEDAVLRQHLRDLDVRELELRKELDAEEARRNAEFDRRWEEQSRRMDKVRKLVLGDDA